ncbi:MAG: hypothetical protein ACTHNU_02705, partial [Gaiellales bacterium]
SATRVKARHIRRDGLPVVEMQLRVTVAHGQNKHTSAMITLDAANRGDHWTWLLPDSMVAALKGPAAT